PLMGVLQRLLHQAGISGYPNFQEALQRYVSYYRWPEWAVRDLKDPLASQVLAVFLAAEEPIPLAELPDRIPGSSPARARAVVDELLNRLALFEDLQPRTFDLVVGLLPVGRQGLIEAGKPRQRPALQVCAAPREIGPEGGPGVNDLRVFLLEVAGEPPRLK